MLFAMLAYVHCCYQVKAIPRIDHNPLVIIYAGSDISLNGYKGLYEFISPVNVYRDPALIVKHQK